MGQAHCISDWGFDFRPDYQRLTKLLSSMSPENPVLATTATANARVTDDVARQLGADPLGLRGSLARSSLRLSVVGGLDGVERMAWVADALSRLPGSGIVYGLTAGQRPSPRRAPPPDAPGRARPRPPVPRGPRPHRSGPAGQPAQGRGRDLRPRNG